MQQLAERSQANPRAVLARRPYKDSAYEQFILWTAMPPVERMKLGIKTQEEFCKENGINQCTPSEWKKRPEFYKRVEALRKEWALDRTSDVIYGIYSSAVKGNDRSQKLWLQYFCGFTEKTEQKMTHAVEVTVNDIRFLINRLPPDLKKKHYAHLWELLTDAAILDREQEIADARANQGADAVPRLTGRVPGEADTNAQNTRGQETYVLAPSYPQRLRGNLVGETQARHHQSAPWHGIS